MNFLHELEAAYANLHPQKDTIATALSTASRTAPETRVLHRSNPGQVHCFYR